MENMIIITGNNGTVRKVFDDYKIFGGVSYKGNFNGSNEFMTLGAVISNEIKFTVRESRENAEHYNNCQCEWTIRHWVDDLPEERETQMGYYNIKNIKAVAPQKVEITAYDCLYDTDNIIVDDFIKNTVYPISLRNFTENLFYDVLSPKGIDGNLVRFDYNGMENFQVKDNFEGINITARMLLSYIAQACCSYMYVDENGYVNMSMVGGIKGQYVNITDYKNIDLSVKKTSHIGQITIKMNEEDLGVSYPENMPNDTRTYTYTAYQIVNNPLLYAESALEIQPVAKSIYNYLSSISYHTGKVELFKLYSGNVMKPGMLVAINDEPFLISNMVIDRTGVKITSNGVIGKKLLGTRNPEIIALRGKTNELYRDIEKTESRLTNKYEGLESVVSQTAADLTAKITQTKETADSAQTKATEAKQTVDGFSQTVTNIETKANEAHTKATEAKQTAEGFDLKIQEIDKVGKETKEKNATLTLRVDKFDSRITDAEGNASSAVQTVKGLTLSASNADSSSTLSLKAGGTVISSANIKINGMVTLSDLSTSGKTTINGANITTGKISADRIEAITVKANTVYDATGSNVCFKGSGNTIEVGGSSIYDFQYMKIYAGDRVTFSSSANIDKCGLIVDIKEKVLCSQSSTIKWDLGNISFGFNEAWIETIHLGGLGGGTISMDASKRLLVNGTVVNITGGTGDVKTSTLTSSSNDKVQLIAKTLQPSINGMYLLGDLNHYWKCAYTQKVQLSSSCYLTASGSKLAVNGTAIGGSSSGGDNELVSSSYKVILSSNTLRPNGTNTYYLGSSSYYWKEIHTNTLVLYYNKYNSIKLACNSSGKLICNNKVIS